MRTRPPLGSAIGILALALLLPAPARGWRDTQSHDHELDQPELMSAAVAPAALAEAPFVDAQQRGSLLYFLFDSPARLERYDLDAGQWLATVLLPPGPTAFAVGPAEMYVAYGTSLYAFELDGTGLRFLRNQWQQVAGLFVADGFLLACGADRVTSLSLPDGSVIDDTEVYYWAVGGWSFDGQALFARSTTVSPADIVRLPVAADGTLGAGKDSIYHGDFPGGDRTFVLPAIGAVGDDSGIVYDATTLEYRGSLAGAYDDLAVDGAATLVARGAELTLYGGDLLRDGLHVAAELPARVFAHGGAAFAVRSEGDGTLSIDRIDFAEFHQPLPATPPAPDGLDFVPDKILRGGDDTVLLLSKANRAVYRWAWSAEQWLETIPTIGPPLDMAVSADGSRLFLGYAGGEVTRVALDAPSFVEEPFVNSPQSPCGLATAGEYLFVCDPSGAWASHFTYDPVGALVSWKEWNYVSTEYIWNESNRRMYFFRDQTSPNDLIWEEIGFDGMLLGELDSPYHGDFLWQHPIRLPADGSVVLIGSGPVFDGLTLVQVDMLPVPIADADWLGPELFTLRGAAGGSRIESWSPALEPLDGRKLPGLPMRLFAVDDGLLAVTLWENRPRFWRRLANLDGPALAVGKTDGAAELAPGSPTTYTITVQNLSDGPLEDVLVEDLFPFGLEDVSWTCAAVGDAACTAGPELGDLLDLADLPAGDSVVYTATASVRHDVVGTLRNRASAYYSGAEEAAATDATDIVVPPLFADGFELGSCTAWSESVGDA